jgi:hypothetical protein
MDQAIRKNLQAIARDPARLARLEAEHPDDFDWRAEAEAEGKPFEIPVATELLVGLERGEATPQDVAKVLRLYGQPKAADLVESPGIEVRRSTLDDDTFYISLVRDKKDGLQIGIIISELS